MESIYFIILPMLVFISVTAIGSSLLLAHHHKHSAFVKLAENRFVDFTKPKRKPTKSLKVLAGLGNIVSHGQANKSLTEQLLRVGYTSNAAPAIYTGLKILLFGIGLIASTSLLFNAEMMITSKITLIMVAASVLFFIPNIYVLSELKKRREEIEHHLPEAVDLLEVCVTSGLGLDMAWNIVSDEVRNVSIILADSMSLTNFEISLGISRVEAMQHMAERTGVEQLSSLAAILIQTEKFGTSVSETLRIFADTMREERSFKAEENAEKMSVKLIFPMVIFIFPVMIVTLAGPALISLMKTLS